MMLASRCRSRFASAGRGPARPWNVFSRAPLSWSALGLVIAACGGSLNAGWDAAEDAGDPLDAGPPLPDAASDAMDEDAGLPDAGEPSDAAVDTPSGLLPVDSRNPVILGADGAYDNWQGEFAILLSSTVGPPLGGIYVNASPAGDLEQSLAGWQEMVAAARDSGLADIPDPVASTGSALTRPSDGVIESTVPNDSEGARLVVETSLRLAEPNLPLVVVTGGPLTDVADAYLIDPTVPERVVVVSALGSASADGGVMGIPNGEMDPWADVIVAEKFRYVQVSGYYDQKADLPDSLVAQLPDNPFASWVRSKQRVVYDDLDACDQVGILAVAIPEFATAVERAVLGEPRADGIPTLALDADGPLWLVTQVDGSVATDHFQQLLLDPATFGGP